VDPRGLTTARACDGALHRVYGASMIGFSESIVLPVSPNEAFAYLGDPTTATTVDPAVVSYESDMDPMDVGAHNKIRARMFGLVMSAESVVRTWTPGELMVIESTKPARPAKGIATHRFERHPEGTLYTWSMEFLPTVPGGSIAARIFAWGFRRAVRRQQERFRDIMAARAAEPQQR